jgi:autotransporter-associated beta strand protein
VTGPGGITVNSADGVLWAFMALVLNGAANDFAGDVVVSRGNLRLGVNHALPAGKVVHVAAGTKVLCDVSQTYASEIPPVINLNGGWFSLGTMDGGSPDNLTVPFAFHVSPAGGVFNGGGSGSEGSWSDRRRITGPIAIAAGGTLNVGVNREDFECNWFLEGPITGAGVLRFYVFDTYTNVFGFSEITGTNNTHGGGTLVARYGTSLHRVIARGEGSLGTGPVVVEAYTRLELDKIASAHWTLTNALVGAGTLRVEDGAGTNTLTAGGTVIPGTNTAGEGAAILTVDGDLAFGAGSRLKIDITGTNGVAGVDFDRLRVDHDLTGLANAVLEVNVSPTVGPGELAGQELVIVSNAAALADTFAAVVWNAPWGGVVKVDDPVGTVKLTTIQQNPDLPYVRTTAATGVVETAAWLDGTVTATGTSETVVWAFWGQTSGGTNAGAWAASTNLGACASAPPADFSFEATELASGRTYIYRYYVENASGGTWSPTESSVRTLGPPLVDNAGGATALRGTTATLNGTVTAGRSFPEVYICWGTNDAGIVSTGAWEHVEALGALDGAFARAIGGLTPGQTYFYRCFATNSYDGDWADTAASFTAAAYDDFAWTGAGSNNWSSVANWSPTTRAPTQAWDRALFAAAAPRQPTVDRGLALQAIQVSGTNGWTWSGAATVGLSQGLAYGSSGTSAWNAALAGAGGVTVGAGQLTLSNTNNAYAGETWVRGGRLHAAGRMGAGVPGVLGAAATPIRLGDTNGSAVAMLSFTNGGAAVTHDRAITVVTGSTGRAVLWSLPGAGGQTLGGALTLGKDTELRAGGDSALTLGANPSGAGSLIKSGAQALLWNRADSPGHTGGTWVEGGLLQWGYTQVEGADETLQFGGGAGLLTFDGGQFELKATVASGVARLTEVNPVTVTTNGGALCAWQNGVFIQNIFTGAIGLGGPLTIGSLTAASAGPVTYRGAITLDQGSGGVRTLRLNHTGSDVVVSGDIADGPGAGGLPLQVGITAGGATVTPFKLSGTNATYAGGTVFTGGRVTLTNPRAVGGGALTLWTNAIGHLARASGATNWAFAQDLAGGGTIQVETGTNTYQLLSQGATVNPGVQAGAVGTLTVAGRYAFGTNAWGQASRLFIDLVATNTAADARADLLRVDHGDAALAASLAQCDLVVNMALPPSVTVLQGSFTILTNTYAKADFAAQPFRSVTVNGGAATVRYASGYVALDVDIKPRPTGVILTVW